MTHRLLSRAVVVVVSLVAGVTGVLFVWKGPADSARLTDAATTAALPPMASDERAGELWFPTKELDLGPQRGEVSCAFAFENRGACDVRVLEAKASCNCGATGPDKELFHPGEKGKITARLTLRPDQVGPKAYSVSLTYEGSERRSERLLLRLVNQPDVLRPDQVNIQCFPGETGEACFTIVDFKERPLKITAVGTSTPALRVISQGEPSSFRPGWHHRFCVKWDSGGKDCGTYRESIMLHAEGSEQSDITVNVMIEQVPRIRVLPGELFLALGDKGQSVHHLCVSDRKGETVEVLSIEPLPRWLRWKSEGADEGGQRIAVTVDRREIPSNSEALVFRVVVGRPLRAAVPVRVFASSLPLPLSPSVRPAPGQDRVTK